MGYNQQRKTAKLVNIALTKAYLVKHPNAPMGDVAEHLNYNGVHVSERTVLRYIIIAEKELAETEKLKLKNEVQKIIKKSKPQSRILQKSKIESDIAVCPQCGLRIKPKGNAILGHPCSEMSGHRILDYWPNDKTWRTTDGQLWPRKKSDHVIGGTNTTNFYY